jgi:hypothetical protein
MSITEFKEKLSQENIRGLALDIDETLSDSNTHWFEHMYKFHAPDGFASAEDVVRKFRFVENVPQWQTKDAIRYVEDTINSNEFNEAIPLLTGADKSVRDINKIIPIVAYITARPDSVREGTKRWLDKHNFPEAELITRPGVFDLKDFNLQKNVWKAGVLRDLYPEVLGIVDDNPLLVHELQKLEYEGFLYLYGGEAEEFTNQKNIFVCRTWPDVIRCIRGPDL